MAVAVLSAAGFCAGATSNVPDWKTPSYTLVAREMDLRTALNTFATAQGLSVVISPAVEGVFSGNFKDVPAVEFLDTVATVHNLTWYYDGAALYIYAAGEIRTLLLELAYMKAGEVRKMLAELGVEDGRFPLKTTSNDEIVLVSGPPRYVSLVAELVARADKLREMRSFSEVEMRLFPLVNTWADNVSFSVSTPESTVTITGVARLLEEMMSVSGTAVREAGASTNSAASASAPEAAADSVFRPVIRPENRLNAVLVRDVKSRMPMYERLVKQLDRPQKLVEIAVTTVELSKKDALDWQLSLKAQGSKRRIEAAAGQNAENLALPADIATKGLAGAITYLGRNVDISASLTALKSKGKARSISRTSLVTMNNLAAQMDDSQSYHVRVIGTEVATLQEVTAGTTLQIKPRIVPAPSTNVSAQVWLTMRLDDGGFESITVDSMPMTRSTSLQTQTAVFEGESIMLAGYMRDIEESGGWGIPYLRDIPFIGWLFGGSSTRTETVQRMFILSPRIIDLDAETLARLQAVRLRDVTEEEKLQDDAEDSDSDRKRRQLERDDSSQRRRERDEDAYKRREAEIKHGREMRRIDRESEKEALKKDIEAWKAEERRAEKERNSGR